MAEDSMALIELMQKADGGDFLRSLAEAVLQLLMEADVVGDRPYGSTGCSANGATECSHNGAIW